MAAIAELKGKFIALNAYIGKDGKFQINTVSFHFKTKKKSKINSKQAKGNIKLRSEIIDI